MDTFFFDQVKHDGNPIYEDTQIALRVVPQTIDEYITYREEAHIIPGEGEMNVSLEYLRSKGIPVAITPYPTKKR